MLRFWYRLYHNTTPAEDALEPAVAALGERYRIQHPFFKHKLFADFALIDRRRIIEVDGKSHDSPKQKLKDLKHMLALKADGWDVVRVPNEQALANPAETVAAALRATPQTTLQLEEALRQLTQNYPDLLVEKPKKPRRRKRRKPTKARAGGKRGAARRKPPGV